MAWGPAFSVSYWTGLAPSALRRISAFDLTLYLGDVAVTVLCFACLLLALRALLTKRRLPARLVASCGLAAIVVFVVEFVRWAVPGSLVLVLIVSIVGAGLLVAGALRLARRRRQERDATRATAPPASARRRATAYARRRATVRPG